MSGMVTFGLLVGAWLILKIGGKKLVAVLIGKAGRAAVGAAAIAKQPDRIHLQKTPRDWKAVPAVRHQFEPLVALGFCEPTAYAVPEMPGLIVHLAGQDKSGIMACVYEHPQAGVIVDIAARYADGTSVTYGNAKQGAGLDQRPGHPSHRHPGENAAALYGRCKRDLRPDGAQVQPSLAQTFENAYAESIAWRKAHGISAAEVQRVSLE